MTTIEAWVVLRKDGTPKQHTKTNSLAVFATRADAEKVDGEVCRVRIEYDRRPLP